MRARLTLLGSAGWKRKPCLVTDYENRRAGSAKARGKRSNSMLNYSGNSLKRSGSLRRVYTRRNPAVYSPSAALAIPTSETIYSRAIAKPKKLHPIPRRNCLLWRENPTNQFRFPGARARRSEICNVGACERKMLLSRKYFTAIKRNCALSSFDNPACTKNLFGY